MSTDDEKPPLDAALRHLAEQQRRSLTSHPTPQELAAYHAGELPPEAEARILDHLAICRECSDLLLDLSGFADLKPPEGMPELTDQQVEQDWQALRAKMRKEAPERKPAEVVPIRPVEPVPRPERTYPVWLPVAASLLAVLGFSFGLYQSARVGKLSEPRVPQVFEYENTRGGTEGGAGDSGKMSSQEGGLFYLPPPEEHPSYRVEIRDGENVLWSTPSLPRMDSIPVDIPGGFLKPGKEYKMRLYGGERGREKALADFALEVE